MIDSRFAIRVQRLAQQDIGVPQIAATLECTEADVTAALCMLALPLPGEHYVAPDRPRDAEIIDRMPKKWQDHYGRK